LTEIINIRFRGRGKAYYFDPQGITVKEGDFVIVETQKGLELGECAVGNHYVANDSIIPPLRPVLRMATAEDLQAAEQSRSREREVLEICQAKISEHGLDMKLVDAEINFEGSKILFFFTSDGRVDFRDLVKDLASVFRARIELRQIGVRDEAKLLGGLGICGRSFCCSQFLDDFHPVSTKMAKTQAMSLNPTKISGSCGRLMCCLRYEQDAYEDLVKKMPKPGAFVETPEGFGSVAQNNLLRQTVKVRLDSAGETALKSYGAEEIAVVPGGRPKPGETPPSILVAKPRIEEPPVRETATEVPAPGEGTHKKHKKPYGLKIKPQSQVQTPQNAAQQSITPQTPAQQGAESAPGGKRHNKRRRYFK